MRLNQTLVATTLWLLGAVSAHAQVAAQPKGYVGVKAGLNIERAEDNLQGTTAGGGAIVGLTFAERWAIEAEFWRPGALRTDQDGRHRDTLYSVGFRRSFGDHPLRPHFLIGVTLGRTEDEFTTCIAVRPVFTSPTPQQVLVSCDEPDIVERHLERFVGTSLFPLVGAGAEIALTDRVRLIPDLRVQVWITSVIVRPALAIGVAF